MSVRKQIARFAFLTVLLIVPKLGYVNLHLCRCSSIVQICIIDWYIMDIVQK